MSVCCGYLEFIRKSGKSPIKYSLERGPTTIGSSMSCDIRIKSKKVESGIISCTIDVTDKGVVRNSFK